MFFRENKLPVNRQMNKLIVFILIFVLVSIAALAGMKYILWAMFRWGGIAAILTTLVFSMIYIGLFLVLTGKWKHYENYISIGSLKWIWIIGVAELGLLGILYHQIPQYFPSFFADFFFS